MMMRRIRIVGPARRAQHLVEFAMVLPVLMFIMTAIIDLGWVFFQDHSINSAARAASRLGAARPEITDGQLRTFVRQYCPWGNFTDADIPVTVVDSLGNAQSGNPRTSGFELRIQVTHTIKFFTPIQRIFQGANATRIRADSQYIIE
jgi:Flp pilus assembly protein TadG